MNARTAVVALAGSLLLGSVPLANAASMSLNGFRHKVLPVLVTVDSHGKVTDMSPAYELQPKMRRMVRSTLDHIVSGPATWKDRPIASQAVINLALEATPRDDGDYDVRWVYAGSQPVPYDPAWAWNHIDGHRLALFKPGSMFHMERHPRPARSYRYDMPTRQAPTRHVAPASRPAPPPPVRSDNRSPSPRHGR